MIMFRVEGVPQPKGSVSAVFRKARPGEDHGRMFRFDSNRKGPGWKAAIREAFAQATGWEEGGPPANDRHVPLAVSVVFRLPKPKKPKYANRPAGKPDIDKLLRAVLDALKGLAYVDDAQVVAVLGSKFWASEGDSVGATIIVDERGQHVSS